jgi:hypothetical protein
MEAERDVWFSQARTVTQPKKTWREKWSSKEENNSEESEEESNNGVTGQRGAQTMVVNMVFMIPIEFHAPGAGVAKMSLGAKWVMFERWERVGEHMMLLYIKGHVDGKLMGCMMVDGGAIVNINAIGHIPEAWVPGRRTKAVQHELDRVYRGASWGKGHYIQRTYSGEQGNAYNVFCGWRKRRYNLLLGRDWIHANGSIPSTLHQCLMRWVGDQVEIVEADDVACVAMAKAPMDVHNGNISCLIGRDLTEYDYVSLGKDGFIPISVKLMASATWLVDDMV